MSAGLSMASVNKIKELANSREYSLALELVEHQDLTKSLNPQFLRLCGEIYIQNGRYEDARRCLIMAHRLGPESKRILFTFVELYLRMGFFELARTYYDMYMFNISSFSSDAKLMQYIWKKHEGAPYEELEEYLTSYAHNLDYDWSYELYFLYKKLDKTSEAKTLAELYHASYKDSENSRTIQDIENGDASVDTYFNVYAKEEIPDDKAEFEKLREEEKNLLAADDLRMHPKEAEITVMYEDSYTPASSEKTIKRLLRKQDKEQERKDKKELKKQKQLAVTEEQFQNAEAVQGAEEKTGSDKVSEEPIPEGTASHMVEIPEKKGFFRQLFKRKGEVEKPAETETERSEAEKPEPEKTEGKETGKPEPEKPAETEAEKPEPEKLAETEDEKPEPEKPAETEAEKPEPEKPAETEAGIPKAETREPELTEDRRRVNYTITNQVIVVDEDDGFEAEAETIEELAKKSEPAEPESEKKKSPFVFQTVELAPEDFEDEYEVDDFSDKPDDEFGEMDLSEEEPIEESAEEEPAEESIEEFAKEEPVEESIEEFVEEEPVEESIEEFVEEEPVEEFIEEFVEEEPVEESIEEFVEEEPVEESIEEFIEEEPAEESIEEFIEEEPAEESIEEFIEEEPVEESIEEFIEEEPAEESIEEFIEEEPVEESIEEFVEEEPAEESIEEFTEEEPAEEQELEKPWVAPFTTKPPKKKLDFPKFKSSLFPNYHKEVKEVENNFHEIMEEAQDKMSENMLREEQMQREAEALLASLGIDLGTARTSKPVDMRKQPEPKGPSRDELKASLKIDSTKKNLLKRLKEYR